MGVVEISGDRRAGEISLREKPASRRSTALGSLKDDGGGIDRAVGVGQAQGADQNEAFHQSYSSLFNRRYASAVPAVPK
jgi:hypothetical protein